MPKPNSDMFKYNWEFVGSCNGNTQEMVWIAAQLYMGVWNSLCLSLPPFFSLHFGFPLGGFTSRWAFLPGDKLECILPVQQVRIRCLFYNFSKNLKIFSDQLQSHAYPWNNNWEMERTDFPCLDCTYTSRAVWGA